VSSIARWLLGLFGWKVVYVPPQVPKAVIIFYPHTSNWDFPIGILARTTVRLPVRFAGKDSLFRWPFGALFPGSAASRWTAANTPVSLPR
jgi:1-acyl-sn-glycerol-3-phosphate acyltransferase